MTSLALLVLVVVAGTEVNGNKNWLDFGGPFRIQPSELAKLSLVLWGADLLARKERLLGQWKHLLVPMVPVGGLILVLVLLGGDLGTAIIIAAVLAALLWVAGAPLRLFLAAGGAGRCSSFALHGQHPVGPDVPHQRLAAPRPGRPAGQRAAGAARQVRARLRRLVGRRPRRLQGEVGRLPEAHTDFIFAIIGEELGLVGTLAVLALFGVIGYAGLPGRPRGRPSRSSGTPPPG